MKMRTIAECHKELLKKDPDTAVTLFALRTLTKSGKIPSVQIGVKRLVSLEIVEDYLKGNVPDSQSQVLEYGKIRKLGG